MGFEEDGHRGLLAFSVTAYSAVHQCTSRADNGLAKCGPNKQSAVDSAPPQSGAHHKSQANMGSHHYPLCIYRRNWLDLHTFHPFWQKHKWIRVSPTERLHTLTRLSLLANRRSALRHSVVPPCIQLHHCLVWPGQCGCMDGACEASGRTSQTHCVWVADSCIVRHRACANARMS